jgi:flavin reductase (DIM6/NTAB) family NADH-FMN oxidoreductase RutF
MPVGFRTHAVAVALTTGSRTERAVVRSGVLALHVLAVDDVATARAFSAPGDRFAGLAWSSGVLGAPVLRHALGVVEATAVSRQHLAGCTVLGAEIQAGYRLADPTGLPFTITTARETGLETARSSPADHPRGADL